MNIHVNTKLGLIVLLLAGFLLLAGCDMAPAPAPGPGTGPTGPTTTSSTVSIAATSATDTSENGTATFTVTATSAPSANLSMTYAVSATTASGDDNAEVADFGDGTASGFPTGTVTILANQATATISLSIYEDSLNEGRESYTVTIRALMPATIGTTTYTIGTASANGSIAPSTDTVSITAASATDTAEGDPATFTVTANPAPSAALSMTYAVSVTTASDDDNAEAADFGETSALAAFPTGTVTIMANQTTATISLPIYEDSLNEARESYTVTISFTSSPTIGTTTYRLGTDSANGSIAPSTGTVSITAASATDTAEGAMATFTVTANPAPSAALSMTYAVSVTTASGDDNAEVADFGDGTASGFPTGTVTIMANQTTATISLPIFRDAVADEARESYTVTISFTSSPTIGTTTYTIGTASANGSIAMAPTGPARLMIPSFEGQPVAPKGTLHAAVWLTTEEARVSSTLNILEEALFEGEQTIVWARIAPPPPPAVEEVSCGFGIIPSSLSFSAASFPIRLGAGSTPDLSLDLPADTEWPGESRVTVTRFGATLRFRNEEGAIPFYVRSKTDTVSDPNEHIELTILIHSCNDFAGPRNYRSFRSGNGFPNSFNKLRLSINEPPRRRFSILHSPGIVPEGTEHSFTINLMDDSGIAARTSDAGLTYTFGGAATFGTDYTVSGAGSTQTGTIAFTPAETSKTLTIAVTNDEMFEGGYEALSLTLSAPTPSPEVVIQTTQASITIADPHYRVVSTGGGGFTVEGNSANFMVSIRTVGSPPARTGNIALRYTFRPSNSFVVPEEFSVSGDGSGQTGTLTFTPTQTQKTLTVRSLPDTVPNTEERNELVYLVLDNVMNSSGRDLVLENGGGGCIRRPSRIANSNWPCTEFRNAEFVTAKITESARGQVAGTAIAGFPYNFNVALARPTSITRMNPLTIDYAFTGSATFATDYTVSNAGTTQTGTLTFPVASTLQILTVTPTASAVGDNITLTISNLQTTSPDTAYIVAPTYAADSYARTISTIRALRAPVITASAATVTATRGEAITQVTFSNTGDGVSSWSIDRSLPAGLRFITSSGIITGTPTVTSTSMVYTVTATNTAGSDTAAVTIVVTDS